ncbi:nitroreductase/quinone reductase family protein [Nonomuraea maheshkhaliensis]|uniref:nitroreductase/quinone reductase family protein n=1 Tax=Nonomuraea maheshkhaliensis TaxID=419590 RepID=UPI0031F8AC69
MNPIAGWLLRTPLHDLLSERVALLALTGRRSGAAIRLPVRYEQRGDTLTVVSRPSRRWWRNLDEGSPVRLTLRGRARHGHATAVRADPVVVVTIRLAAEQPGPPQAQGRLWWRWTKAVTLGEITGFAVPAVVAAQVAGPEWTLLGIGPLLQGAAIVMAGAVEGMILGLAQAYVLRAALPAIPTRAWVRATAAGAVIAWSVGVLPIVLGERIVRWPPAVLVLLGLSLLGSMGLLQARVLRGQVREAWRWVIASAGSWLIALGAFALVTTPLWQEGQPGWLVVTIGVLGGVVMAATVAALTGAAIVRLLSSGDDRCRRERRLS